MTPSWARPGVKVVCVDATSGDGEWLEGEAPLEGDIYTIFSAWTDEDGEVVLDFVELSRLGESCEFHGGGTLGYGAYRFRPLITRTQEQDVALFVHHLTGVEENV